MNPKNSPLALSDSVSRRVSRALRKAASAKLSGFTLAELIVVIAVLAILSAVALVALSGYRQDARDAAVKANVRSVYSAIAAESAARQESARCFVVHDSEYALSGGVVVFDGNLADSLSGGPCGTPGTNYSAGNPDYGALRLDPEKFRLSLLSPGADARSAGRTTFRSSARPAAGSFPSFRLPFLPASAAGTGTADPSLLLVGAADLSDLSWPKPRLRTFAQVAAVLSSDTAYVAGDFPTGGAEDGSVAGLIRDAAFASSSTGALVDGAPVGEPAPCPESEVSGYSVPYLANGESAAVSQDLADGGGQKNGRAFATASCSYGTVRIKDETASCDPDYVPALPAPSCVRDSCSGALPENALATGTPGTAAWSYSETPGTCSFACDSANGYLWNSGTLSCEKSCSTGNLASFSGLDYVLPVALTVPNGGSASSSGTHAFGSHPASGTLVADFAFSCSHGTLGTVSSAGSGSCASAPSHAFNSDFSAPACLPVAYQVSGSFGAGASGAQISGCGGKTATAGSSGNFSFSGVLHGTDCSDVSVSKPEHSCSVSKSGPSSLVSNISDIAGSCSFNVAGIAGSLRFNGANGYLNRTPSAAGNQKKWTWSGWVKSSRNGSTQHVLTSGTSGTNYALVSFSANGFLDATDTLKIYSTISNSTQSALISSAFYRDPSAWYHLLVSVDTADSTPSNRVKAFINGRQVPFSWTFPPQNSDFAFINSTTPQNIGTILNGTYGYFSGYFANVHFVDGQALPATEFGETDGTTGSWKPKNYSGTYGTNGFRLDFSDVSGLTSGSNAGIGKDSSGNSNYWNTNNVVLADRVIDHPTNNFATLNPLDNVAVNAGAGVGSFVLTAGNLRSSESNSTNTVGTVRSSISPNSGKWYWEVSVVSKWGNYGTIGIKRDGTAPSLFGGDNGDYAYRTDGNKRNGSTSVAYGSSLATNDVVGVALDANAGTLEFYRQAWGTGPFVSQWVAFSGLGGASYSPALGDEQNASANVFEFNFGQWGQSGLQYCENAGGYFKSCPPSGFKALSTKNLTPSITNPKQHFDVLTYVGTSANNTVSWLAFQPDLLWFKNRDAAAGNAWMDSVRWWNKALYSYSATSESSEASPVTFPSVGSFTIPSSYGWSWNDSGNKYVTWAWKGGGAALSNTAGTIASQVSANPAAGFSIISATTPASAGAVTIGHGLGTAPSMIVFKNRSQSADWLVWHKNLNGGIPGSNSYLKLNSIAAQAQLSGMWGTAAPNPTTFGVTVGTTVAGSNNLISYAFAEVPGFSKFGSYVGNGSTDGPFVHTGFRPRWIMAKRIDSGTDGWVVIDTVRNPNNVADKVISADLSNAEWTDTYFDILSNGFKGRRTGASTNASGGTYVYAAFAEAPFGWAGIAPATAR